MIAVCLRCDSECGVRCPKCKAEAVPHDGPMDLAHCTKKHGIFPRLEGGKIATVCETCKHGVQ